MKLNLNVPWRHKLCPASPVSAKQVNAHLSSHDYSPRYLMSIIVLKKDGMKHVILVSGNDLFCLKNEYNVSKVYI